MQGNFFSLSSLEGGGTSRPQRGSKDSASRNRFSVGPFSLITAPCSSSMASESEWERVEDPGIGVDVQRRGDLGVTSWAENTPLWSELPSMPSTRRVVTSLCNCKMKHRESLVNRCENLSEAVSFNQRHGGSPLFSRLRDQVATDTTKIYGEPSELAEEHKHLGTIF